MTEETQTLSSRDETQESISAWAAETFGEPGSILRVAARVNEEMSELIRAITAEQPKPAVIDEAADVLIVLARLASRLYVELKPLPIQAYSLTDACEIVLQANQAMADLMVLCHKRKNIAKQMRLVWKLVNRVIWQSYGNPQAAINAKMAINRARVWKKDGTGHGYHTRDKSLTA